MNNEQSTDLLYLTKEERTMLSLRSLYKHTGYASFKMSRFEEYDLYVKNKEFLIGDSVMTFTDTDGRLLALKPDVTLSIVKNFNGDAGTLEKYCYDERVFRFSKEKHGFTELLQSGIECLGAVDLMTTAEVITLAADSLSRIGTPFLLELSHMSVIKAIVAAMTDSEELQRKIFHAIGEKNLHELKLLCNGHALFDTLEDVLSLRGEPLEVLTQLRLMNLPDAASEGIKELAEVSAILSNLGIPGIVLDFSLVSDVRYYNGILFRGFVGGVPERVLSGGRYDPLMQRMGKNGGAIGFAVYLNTLERFEREESLEHDFDFFLLYNEKDDAVTVSQRLYDLRAQGYSVCAGKRIPTSLSFSKVIDPAGNEVSVK